MSQTIADLSIVMDGRWRGNHGIGRYSREVGARILAPALVSDERVQPATIRDPIFLARAIRKAGATLFYTPGYNVAGGTRCSQLITIHDLIHLDVKEERSISKAAYYECLVKPVVRRNGCVTVSQCSADRIAAWAGISRELIVVSQCGLSPAFQAPAKVGCSSALRVSSRPFVLAVGSPRPHRSFALLQEAMKCLPDLDLVTVGTFPAAAYSPSPRWVRLNGVSDGQLACLYRDAACVAVPSLHEGFGLPVLEALSQGAPVVYRAEACDEIGRGLGTRVSEACSAEEFADALRAAAEARPDEQWQLRAMARANTFSWDAVARTVAEALAARVV